MGKLLVSQSSRIWYLESSRQLQLQIRESPKLQKKFCGLCLEVMKRLRSKIVKVSV